MSAILKFCKKHAIGFGLTLGTIIIVLFFHRVHLFDNFELKVIDLAFKVRGPLSGWAARKEIPKDSLDIVIIDIDDESYRLVPWTWPYPREVWAITVENLTRAGAKVIVFDIQLDSPDRRAEYLKGISRDLKKLGMEDLIPAHGDSVLADAIREAQAKGTSVILATKLVQEPTRIPPQYIQFPVEVLRSADPDYGLVNEEPDTDGFSRQYFTFLKIEQERDTWYSTLGIKAVQKYLNLPDTTLPHINLEDNILNYGPLKIPLSSKNGKFLINFYGPPSGINIGEYEAWKTFNRYPLSNVVDIADVDLKDPDEDIDWMSQFLPGEIPAWLDEIEDPDTKAELMVQLGIGDHFDITQSPFYNKIVMIGVSVEVFHDTKSTPFYTFAGQQQLMPGMEVHANAIQTLLDQNFIHVFGGNITWNSKSWVSHALLISGLSILTYLFITFLNPLFAGLSIVLGLAIFFSVAIGAFTNDSLWLVKQILGNWSKINVPEFGQSTIILTIAPIFGVVFTYISNILYKFIMEQKDKRFLKNTFGAYLAPELIDQMYEEKREPKLGGDIGYHTAFFSDIQSFSAFSEVLDPEKIVSLMNEYLTAMTDILLHRRGTLDKYIGDAIVAFWGAPVPVDDQEYQACMTALEMEKQLVVFREKWSTDGDWPEIVQNIRHRVGLNSGELVTGNMGSKMRMNYTMMGDMVNIAARLESSAKQYGIYIQVGENAYNAVKDQFEWRILDHVRVKGKKMPVKVFELLSEKGKLDDIHSKVLPIFHEGLEYYNSQKWDKANKAFAESDQLEDMFPTRPTNPSRVYIERCQFFKENPPGDDWDGVWTLTAK
ncbi:MAG: adenylate/guanylate cyclase domain-containing protein [Candidatus Marinimicrobia bacterium]|nr:adenylate/guanylate cyclase domain-containing protein [Candidatus Neomarinimicrobiota bacterium]